MEDSDGARYDIKIEGNVTRDKVLKIFEMMDLMNIEEDQETTNMDSVGSKIWHIVDKFFPIGKFTSTNILEKYEDEFNEPVKLSVISTSAGTISIPKQFRKYMDIQKGEYVKLILGNDRLIIRKITISWLVIVVFD